jgi:WD40 repeat protein
VKHSRMLFAACLLILALFPHPGASAQDMTPIPSSDQQYNTQSDTVLLLQGSSVISWNLNTSAQMPYLNLADNISRPDGLLPEDKLIVMNPQLGRDSHALYFLMGFGQDGLSPPQHTKMMWVDLSTFEATTIFEKEGLSNFALSPNNQRAIVTYFEGEYGKSRQYSCVLDLASGNCAPGDMAIGNWGWTWVDDESYIILSRAGRKFYLIDANSLEAHPLPVDESWYLQSFTLIPDTRKLLISARQRTDITSDASQFLRLDLDTEEVTDFAYDAVSSEYSSVSDWQFSPDGKYLLYGSVSERALIDFHTGELIAEFKDATQAEWLSNDDLLITRWQEPGKILETIRFEVERRQSEMLIEGEYIGYIIVPDTPLPTPQSDALTLRDILSAPNCQIACLLGIEPGVTNHADLENILNSLGIPFESRPIGNAGMITSYNFDAPIDSPFIPNGHEPIGVMLSPDQVEQVDFEVTGVTVQDILNWYGAPASVGNVGTNVLVYPDLGLIFFVSDKDNNSIDLVYLRTYAGVMGHLWIPHPV